MTEREDALKFNVYDEAGQVLCPCCGLSGQFSEAVYDKLGGIVGSGICAACTWEPGFDDDPMASALAQSTILASLLCYRQEWIDNGWHWRTIKSAPAPANWNPRKILASLLKRAPKLGLPIAPTKKPRARLRFDPATVARFKLALNMPAKKNERIDGHALAAELIGSLQFNALPVMTAAAKGSKKREHTLASIFLERGDAGCAVSDAAIRQIIFDENHVTRNAVMGSMQHSEQSRFARDLRDIARNPQDKCWPYAVATLGEWRDLQSIDILMAHTDGCDTPFVLLFALMKMRAPEAAIEFEANLVHPEPRSHVIALWGLAALGSEQAIAALITLLDDPDVSTENSFEPGQSMRAAQALADVLKLEFKWGDQKEVKKIKNHLIKLYNQTG